MGNAEAHRRLQHVLWEQAGHAIPDEGVLVSIDLFFTDNHDVGSIAPNLVEGDPNPVMRHPGVDAIRRRLEEIRARPDVIDVLVDVMVEWEEYPEGEWPYAQAIQVVTTASPETVDSWIEGLNADPCGEASGPGGWVNPPEVPAGYRIITIWWD
jgi:hypothetical protein